MENIQRVKDQLKKYNLSERYLEMPSSTATVPLAAQAIGCEEDRIAKTLSFKTKQGAIVIVASGQSRVDNKKFKEVFKEKAVFLKGEEVPQLTGHPIGGVSPFGLKDGVRIYLDLSLKKYDYVYPAAGAPNNAVKLSPAELETASGGTWTDVCKQPQP
ncbi:MAG: YbaK/EbsC family protein [Elusimicrobiaceae bacterium]